MTVTSCLRSHLILVASIVLLPPPVAGEQPTDICKGFIEQIKNEYKLSTDTALETTLQKSLCYEKEKSSASSSKDTLNSGLTYNYIPMKLDLSDDRQYADSLKIKYCTADFSHFDAKDRVWLLRRVNDPEVTKAALDCIKLSAPKNNNLVGQITQYDYPYFDLQLTWIYGAGVSEALIDDIEATNVNCSWKKGEAITQTPVTKTCQLTDQKGGKVNITVTHAGKAAGSFSSGVIKGAAAPAGATRKEAQWTTQSTFLGNPLPYPCECVSVVHDGYPPRSVSLINNCPGQLPSQVLKDTNAAAERVPPNTATPGRSFSYNIINPNETVVFDLSDAPKHGIFYYACPGVPAPPTPPPPVMHCRVEAKYLAIHPEGQPDTICYGAFYGNAGDPCSCPIQGKMEHN